MLSANRSQGSSTAARRAKRALDTGQPRATRPTFIEVLPSLFPCISLFLLLIFPSASFAKSFLTQEEALRLAFPPGAAVQRKTAFLSEADRAEVVRRTGGAPPTGLVVFYAATQAGRDAGTAYFDTHVVRTEPETLLVLIDPAGTIARIEILSFSEPDEYLPRAKWYGQFGGKHLDDDLSEKRGVRPVTGATLTVRATVEAARRVLALDAFLREKGRR
jgi:hypothetical protein